MPIYRVKTQDVDHRETRRFKTFEGARKRFEEMVGYTMEAAIAEHYGSSGCMPSADTVTNLRAVSNFGCVVTYSQGD